MYAVMLDSGFGALVDGKGLSDENGTDCCCGDGGGERYKIYLHRYCTRQECKNFIYVWSDEIAYNDVLWKDTSGWFKFAGACYFTQSSGCDNGGGPSCEDNGPSCCETIPYAGPSADGPPLTGSIEDHCGPCCGEFGDQDLCRTLSFWSCAEQRWKCREMGEADDVYIRATKHRTMTVSSAFIAFQDRINAGNPNYRSCWHGGLVLDERESFVIRYENRLVPDSEGCLSLVPTCRQAQYDYYQGQWYDWNNGNPPSCEWVTGSGGGDYCQDTWRFTFWGQRDNYTEINPFTGGPAGLGEFQCTFNDSGCDSNGRNCWTRQYANYADGLIRSITDRTITHFDTVDENNNVIPYGIYVEEFTYIRQLTVTVPCDGDTNRGCGMRAVCADPNRPPPPENLPKTNPKRPSLHPKLPELTGTPPRATNPRFNLPTSTGGMF